MGWLADRWATQARDAAHLRDRGRGDSAAAARAIVGRCCTVFALLFGIGLGGDYMIIPLMAADLFGVQLGG